LTSFGWRELPPPRALGRFSRIAAGTLAMSVAFDEIYLIGPIAQMATISEVTTA
jgi:hypothetical protein